MENKIQVLVLQDPCEGEIDMCYRLDDPESAQHCFNNFLHNYDSGQEYKFIIKEMTAEEWAECERIGEEMA